MNFNTNTVNLFDNYTPVYSRNNVSFDDSLYLSDKRNLTAFKFKFKPKLKNHSNFSLSLSFSKKMAKINKINSTGIQNTNKISYKTAFKELIPQFFRSKDAVILNKFNDNLFVKKQLLNRLLNIIGVPISLGHPNRYTFDRILEDSHLVIKTNNIFSPKTLYKTTIKKTLILKNLSDLNKDNFSIQRINLIKKRKFRKKINSLKYFDNDDKEIVYLPDIKKLFKVVSDKIKNKNNLSSVIIYNNNNNNSNFLSSLTHLFKKTLFNKNLLKSSFKYAFYSKYGRPKNKFFYKNNNNNNNNNKINYININKNNNIK